MKIIWTIIKFPFELIQAGYLATKQQRELEKWATFLVVGYREDKR